MTAVSGTTLSYQWYFKGSAIAGATSSTYTISNVRPSHAGGYYVAVKNAGGTVNSRTATLTILFMPPAFTSSRADAKEFVCRVTGSEGIYLLQGTTDFKNWFPVSTRWSTNGFLDMTNSHYALAVQAGLAAGSTVNDAVTPMDHAYYRIQVKQFFSDLDLANLALNGGRFLAAWTNQYNGSRNEDDFLQAMTLDARGNVYVTGYAREASGTYDYVTLKYNSAGERLWRAVYDGGVARDDHACAVAVDNDGNVFVTGSSQLAPNAGGWDYLTIKYDGQGNQLWVRRHNGASNKDDFARALALDAAGNVFVTGSSKDANSTLRYLTIKYNSSGQSLWTNVYISPGQTEGDAASIAVDGAGNAYVTGKSKGSSSDYDFATIKYSADGDPLWVARYNGAANSADEAVRVVVDSAQNVYVTGASRNSSGDYDYATLKYDPDGAPLWVQRYNGTAGKEDIPAALVVDPKGNVFVTGSSRGAGNKFDYLTIKYSPEGEPLWVQRYDNPAQDDDKASAIALDRSGNVYVTGASKRTVALQDTGFDFVTIKYNGADGALRWRAQFHSADARNDTAVAIAVDDEYSVYVAGQAYYRLDYAVVKYLQEWP